MGINISIVNRELEKHPGWDWIRRGNDREFYYTMLRLPHVPIYDEEGYCLGLRPGNLGFLRRMVAGWEDKERYLKFCDILEGDEQWFLRVVL